MESDRFPSWTINGDLVILDRRTSLEWTGCFGSNLNWDQAQEYCDTLNSQAYAGPNDWRLPTIEELWTLIDFQRANPASSFPDMPPKTFWSSSSYAYNTGYAWLVYFAYGHVNHDYKTYGYAARCVRGGPSVLDSSKKKEGKKEKVPPFSQMPLRRF